MHEHRVLCDGTAAYCLTCKEWLPDHNYMVCPRHHPIAVEVFGYACK